MTAQLQLKERMVVLKCLLSGTMELIIKSTRLGLKAIHLAVSLPIWDYYSAPDCHPSQSAEYMKMPVERCNGYWCY